MAGKSGIEPNQQAVVPDGDAARCHLVSHVSWEYYLILWIYKENAVNIVAVFNGKATICDSCKGIYERKEDG